jgi:REP element-mobilizing transposase RayT
MGRVPRSSLPDGCFHVVTRGVAERGEVFRDDDDRSTFLKLLLAVVRRHDWTCHAFCLMGTHYHLVLDSRRTDLSRGLHRLNLHYARYFNERHGLFGHLFADRFSARLIESEEYLYAACAYTLLNPVRAGLCEHARDWPWSYSRFGLEVAV